MRKLRDADAMLNAGNDLAAVLQALEVDRGITGEDVIDTLAEPFAMRGVPGYIRSDNGPEFIAQAIQRWLAQVVVQTLYIGPGAPWENGYAESFPSRLRDKFLALEESENLTAARKLTMAGKEDCYLHRPHSSLSESTVCGDFSHSKGLGRPQGIPESKRVFH